MWLYQYRLTLSRYPPLSAIKWIILQYSNSWQLVRVYGFFYCYSQIAKFMGLTWGPPGSFRPQMGPMLAPWTLLSGSSRGFEVSRKWWQPSYRRYQNHFLWMKTYVLKFGFKYMAWFDTKISLYFNQWWSNWFELRYLRHQYSLQLAVYDWYEICRTASYCFCATV